MALYQPQLKRYRLVRLFTFGPAIVIGIALMIFASLAEIASWTPARPLSPMLSLSLTGALTDSVTSESMPVSIICQQDHVQVTVAAVAGLAGYQLTLPKTIGETNLSSVEAAQLKLISAQGESYRVFNGVDGNLSLQAGAGQVAGFFYDARSQQVFVNAQWRC